MLSVLLMLGCWCLPILGDAILTMNWYGWEMFQLLDDLDDLMAKIMDEIAREDEKKPHWRRVVEVGTQAIHFALVPFHIVRCWVTRSKPLTVHYMEALNDSEETKPS